jgi:integrase
MTNDELRDVLAAFSGSARARNRALMIMQATTGLRISEVLSLNVGDVVAADRVRDVITIERHNLKNGKKSAPRPGNIEHIIRRVEENLDMLLADVIPGTELDRICRSAARQIRGKKTVSIDSRTFRLMPMAWEALDAWWIQIRAQGQILKTWPFFCTTTGKRLSRVGAYKAYRSAYRRAGLDDSGLATHGLRKTYARIAHDHLKSLKASGTPVNILLEMQKLLGHAKITSTTSYVQTDEEIQNGALDAIEDVVRSLLCE